MSSTAWYVRLGDQVLGPISDAELRDRAMQGDVTAQTPVSRDGKGWTEVVNVPGIVFRPGLQQPVPSPLSTEPSSPPSIPTARPASTWQATGRSILTHASRVTRYVLTEAWATICATASLIVRAIKYGNALGYLRFLEQAFRRSQLDLGEQMYRSNVGDTTVRESIRTLDEQIKRERAAKRPAARLLANRRELILRLAATSAAGDAAIQSPQRQEVQARQHELEEQHAAVKATRAGLLPCGAVEIRRVVLGFGVILLAIIAFGLWTRSGSPVAQDAGVASATEDQAPSALRGNAGQEEVITTAKLSSAEVATPSQASNKPDTLTVPSAAGTNSPNPSKTPPATEKADNRVAEVKSDGESVVKKLDGKVLSVPLAKLSIADQRSVWAPQSNPMTYATSPLKPGDFVVTVEDKVEIGMGGTQGEIVPKGTKLEVMEIRGAWVGVRIDGKKKAGWVLSEQVGLKAQVASEQPTPQGKADPNDKAPTEQSPSSPLAPNNQVASAQPTPQAQPAPNDQAATEQPTPGGQAGSNDQTAGSTTQPANSFGNRTPDDAGYVDAPINVRPRSDVDERLFLLRVLENMYTKFPVESDKAVLTKNLGDFRHQINRHHDYLMTKNIDTTLTSLYGDLLKSVDAYSSFLAESDWIEKDAVARAERESTESGFRAGVAGGGVAAELYNNQDYSGGDATLAGLATAAVTYLWDDYNKGKRRDAAKQQAVEAAIERLKNDRSRALARAQNSANDLADRNGWQKGEAGFDEDDNDKGVVAAFVQAGDIGGLARFFDRVKRRRPRDPFVVVQNCAVKSLNPQATSRELMLLSKECLDAASLVPAGWFYNQYRASVLYAAGDLANRAWSMECQYSGFGRAHSKTAKWAVRIWDACLAYDPKDSSGEIRERRAWALMASGKLEEALAQAEEVVDLRRNTTRYAVNMASLLSYLHKTESIGWFEHAVRDLGYNSIAFSRKNPDLAWMRETESVRFEAVTDVKFKSKIAWGLFSDDIAVTNNSAFTITNVKVTARITSSGYDDWMQTFQVGKIGPGETYTWNTRIGSRGDDAVCPVLLDCDQSLLHLQDPRSVDWLKKAVTYEEKGDHDKAIAAFTEVIRLDPKCALAYGLRGTTYKEKGEHDKAIADCTEAIRLDPENAVAHRWRGVSYEGKGEYDKAIADYNEVIRLNPNDITAYADRAVANGKKREKAKAEEDHKRAKELGYKSH